MSNDERLPEFITQPPCDDLVIWRYIDFTKFVAMLETQSLYFVRIASLDDPFEGSFPIHQTPQERILSMLPANAFPPGATVLVSPSAGLEEHWKLMRYWAMVSCWHALEYESAAMWKLYAPVHAGIAIHSTVGRLREALGAPPPPPEGFFGGDRYHINRVEYIDFRSSDIPIENGVAQFLHKRRSFEHEHEIRAVLMRWPVNADNRFAYEQRPCDSGQQMSINLKTLIHGIRVAPQAPDWYLDLVHRILDRYEIDIKPHQSELDADPLY